ncbi:MAG: MerC domain-containing protein [Verrucomicrobiota bacterium]
MSLTLALPRPVNADRFGVIASTLCAIHCAVTPFLLILLPTFGKVWPHPASHWGMALIVVPIAIWMLKSGYQRHRRRGIVALGIFGVVSVLIGAGIPYLEKDPTAAAAAVAEVEVNSEAAEAEVFVWKAGDELEDTESEVFVWTAEDGFSDEGQCADSCCPSFITDGNGDRKLHIPLASIVTTIGGLALIITHIGNLNCCPDCERGDKPEL